jgi:serine/threonine protein phosphatase 1
MRNRVKDFIPKDHLDFFISLLPYYEFENYIFVHGGCNPAEPLNKQSISQLVWDRDLFDFAKRNPNNLSWDKTIVTGHNGFERDHPYISQKFLMLDCSYNHKLISIELNSMECFVAGKNKDKLVKLELRPLVF